MEMKKITLAISALLLSNSALAATVYSDDEKELNIHGRAQGMYYFSGDDDSDGDQSYIRVGLSGKSQINQDYYAFGLYELEFKSNRRDDSDEDDEFDVRKGYIGVGADYGTISYGRQYGAVTLVSDYTDIFPEFGNEAAGVSSDLFGTGRSDSVFKLTGHYQDLTVHASYQAENDEVVQTNGETDASSFGLAANYKLPYGFNVALGYNQGEGLDEADDQTLITTAISYQYDKLYLAALYSDGENWAKDGSEDGVDYTGIEAVATYQVTEKLSALIGYNGLERDDEDTVDSYSIGGEYQLTENFKTLAEYKINDIEGEDDIFAVAARYSF
ncbi:MULTISPECIES: porin [unclassified Vibrio]|uniref:Porin n=1 Tax=Vibrio sp. HB236076 TaxID=3232307 RepID=A0AB39HBD5_9VIBR|nr:porin [Vibrio sp. HB161653]MDP5254439.1 porin [Vibrio sp. HB161653]